MSVIQSPKFFKLLSWIAIVATTVVELVPLNRHGRVSTVRSRPSERAIKDLPSSGNLGNSDITKLLDDLDNQTEAIRSGQEIGEELLGGKNQTGLRENELERSNEYSYDESKGDSFPGEVKDNSSQAVSTAGAPVLVDRDGVPEKTTALENGASYLAGKPLLIFNNKSKDLDVSKWFLYYPLTTETDEQRA
ncbi:uncharacterized protein LOC111328402 isoform X2 [Stylophora pistillata]|uniref:uncharacterized protein LOC111328402 isoform X2 n=1 Tax=Stylophora pistillata TaxID=50429 RepID=UPI000C03B35D|nr:uncharacterized protein LOC111328402 isoform X2 [Stylophora pistillata]